MAEPATTEPVAPAPESVDAEVGLDPALIYGVVQASTDGWSAASALVPILAGIAILASFAVIESRFDAYDAMLTGVEDSLDIRAGFERWLDSISSDVSGEWIALFQLLAHARHEPKLADVFQRRNGKYRDVFASILAKGQRQGSVRKDISAELLADQLSAMGDGWMMLFPIEPGRFQPKRVKALLDATMALIAPRGASRVG